MYILLCFALFVMFCAFSVVYIVSKWNKDTLIVKALSDIKKCLLFLAYGFFVIASSIIVMAVNK